ncbi:MAG: hypothetical protein AAF078_11925, partial [Planctomycetota bacterium]
MTEDASNNPNRTPDRAAALRIARVEAQRLINAMLDGDLSPDERRRLNALAQADPKVAEEVVRARRVVNMLAAPAASSMETASAGAAQDAILHALAERGAIRTPRHRRRIGLGRSLIALSLITGIAGIALVQRSLPDLRHGGLAGARPLAAVVESTQADAGSGVRTLVATVRGSTAAGPNTTAQPSTALIAAQANPVGVAAVREGTDRVRHLIRAGSLDGSWDFSRTIRLNTLGAGTNTPARSVAVTWSADWSTEW